MKKLYSLVLMATALLIGTNAWAGDVATVTIGGSSTSYSSLLDAFNSITAGQTATITMTDDASLVTSKNKATTVSIGNDLDARRNITWDLNGHTVTLGAATAIYLYKGTLTLRNSNSATGEFKHTGKSFAFYVTGTYKKENDPRTATSEDQIFSHLVVEKGVKINSTVGTGVELMATSRTAAVNEGKGVYIYYDNDTHNDGNPRGVANGVRIDVYGDIYGAKYAVQTNGQLAAPIAQYREYYNSVRENFYPGAPEIPDTEEGLAAWMQDTMYCPYIHIYENATLTADSTKSTAVAAYSSGYARWYIEGDCAGATGLYMKSGSITLDEANIRSSYTDDATLVAGATKGVTSAGNAIVVESNNHYTGNSELNIEGGTTVSTKAEDGVALAEVIAAGSDSRIEEISINGATLTGDVAIVISSPEGEDHKIETVTVSGANFNGDISVLSGDVDAIVSNGAHATVVGNTIVVSEGAGPADEAKKAEWDDVAALSNKTNPVDAAWTAAGTGTIDGTTIYLGELQIISGTAGNLQQLTIDNGASLIVDKLIMNDYARIIVEAGGKLIVKGTQGINAPVVENILLKSTEDKQAYFLFHPNVSSNKYPNATVELYTNCKQLSESPWTYTYQRFALPIIEGATPENDFSGSLFGSETAFENYVWEWNGSSWVVAPNWASLNPFKGYQLANNSSAGGVTYKFKGQLVGNGNANYEFPTGGYDVFGSSHMAPIYIDSLLKPYETSNMEATVWVYDYNTSNFKAVNSENIKDFPALFKDEIKPMDAFVLRIQASSGSSTMSYASAIWGNPNFDAAIGRASQKNAPARVRTNASNRAIISIVAENGYSDQVTLVEKDKFSAEFDNGADASKYMYENGINLYAVTEAGDLSSVATDNLAGTMLSFRAGNDTQYTINFTNVLGEDYALRDNVTGQVITLTEGASYSFMQEANSTVPARFEIVGRQNMPTAIDNVEEAAKATGIYTITGQYLGRDFSNLPAGVYIVNGVKVVK